MFYPLLQGYHLTEDIKTQRSRKSPQMSQKEEVGDEDPGLTDS